jgi:hypothetical protein
MKFFPKVYSPCPYKGALSDIMDGEICRLCKREVHDLTDMAEDFKRALFDSCTEDLCVTYRIDMRPALAAVAVGAGVMAPTALAAKDNAGTIAPYAAEDSGERVVVVGGGTRRSASDWQSDEDIRQAHNLQTLPVVYEDKPASRNERAGGAPDKVPKRG